MSLDYQFFESQIIKRIVVYSVFVSLILMLNFSDQFIFKTSAIILCGLCILYIVGFSHSRNSVYERYKKSLVLVLFLIGFFCTLIPFNPFYLGLDVALPIKWYVPIINWEFFMWFSAAYGWLTLFALVAMAIIVFYFKRKTRSKGTGRSMRESSKKDVVTPIFDNFIEQPTFRKILVLLFLLIIASFVEEVIYRYAVFNFIYLALSAIPAISMIVATIASGLIFGWAHKDNGYVVYIVNSSLAGFVFAIMFVQYGLDGAWLLHFAWNLLVVFERKIELIMRS